MTAPSRHPDQVYVEALLQNDSQRIDEVYEKCAPIIRRHILQNSGNEADAQDIFSEGLMAMVRRARRGNLQLTCPFCSYLLMVCRSLWLNKLKRRKRTGPMLPVEAVPLADQVEEIDSEGTVQEQERYRLFTEALATLPESCQQILRLSLGGKKMKEVADNLGLQYGYARKRKSECWAKLLEWVRNAPGYEDLKY